MNNNETISDIFSDIAGSIRTKTGKDNLMTANEMSSEIESIPSGISNITNGTLYHYKATSNTVPAGTFIKLDTNLQKTDCLSIFTDVGRANNKYPRGIYSIFKIDDFYISPLYIQSAASGSSTTYHDTFLLPLNITSNGLTKKYDAFNTGHSDNGYGSSGFTSDFIVQLTTEKILCIYVGATKMHLSIYNIVNGSFILESSLDTDTYSTITGYTTNDYGNILRDVFTSEDDDYIYVHLAFRVNYSGNSYDKNAMICFIIDKETYSIDYDATRYINLVNTRYGNRWVNIIQLSDNQFLEVTNYADASWCIVNFNTATKTYSRTTGSFSYSISNYYGIGSIVKLGNNLLYVHSTDANTMKYSLIEISNNLVTLQGSYTIHQDESSIFSSSVNSSVVSIDDNTALLLLYNSSNVIRYIVFKLINSEITFGSLTSLGSFGSNLSYNSSSRTQVHIIKLENGVFALPLGTTFGLYKITGTVLESLDDSSVTVSPCGVTKPQGITATNCTDTVAGDVYIVNSN